MVCSEQLGISFVLLQPTFTLSILLSVIHYLAGGAGPGLLMVRVIYRVFCVWNPKYLLGLKPFLCQIFLYFQKLWILILFASLKVLAHTKFVYYQTQETDLDL